MHTACVHTQHVYAHTNGIVSNELEAVSSILPTLLKSKLNLEKKMCKADLCHLGKEKMNKLRV